MSERARQAVLQRRLAVIWGLLLITLYAQGGRIMFGLPYFGVTLQSDRVARVHPGGPAEDAGLMPGDHLILVDGTPWGRIPFFPDQ